MGIGIGETEVINTINLGYVIPRRVYLGDTQVWSSDIFMSIIFNGTPEKKVISAKGDDYVTVTCTYIKGKNKKIIESGTSSDVQLTTTSTTSGLYISGNTVKGENRGTTEGLDRSIKVTPGFQGYSGDTVEVTQSANYKSLVAAKYLPTSFTRGNLDYPSSGSEITLSGMDYCKWSGTYVSEGARYSSGAETGMTRTTIINQGWTKDVYVSGATYPTSTPGLYYYDSYGREEVLDGDFKPSMNSVTKLHTVNNHLSDVLSATTTMFVTGYTQDELTITTLTSTVSAFQYVQLEKTEYYVKSNDLTIDPTSVKRTASGDTNSAIIKLPKASKVTQYNYWHPLKTEGTDPQTYEYNSQIRFNVGDAVNFNLGYLLYDRYKITGLTSASIEKGQEVDNNWVIHVYPTSKNLSQNNRSTKIYLKTDEDKEFKFSGTTTQAYISFMQEGGTVVTSHTLTNLQVKYNSGSALHPSGGTSYAYITGSYNTYYDGEYESSTTVTVTPINTYSSDIITINGNNIAGNKTKYGTTEKVAQQITLGAKYGNTTSDTTVTINTIANTKQEKEETISVTWTPLTNISNEGATKDVTGSRTYKRYYLYTSQETQDIGTSSVSVNATKIDIPQEYQDWIIGESTYQVNILPNSATSVRTGSINSGYNEYNGVTEVSQLAAPSYEYSVKSFTISPTSFTSTQSGKSIRATMSIQVQYQKDGGGGTDYCGSKTPHVPVIEIPSSAVQSHFQLCDDMGDDVDNPCDVFYDSSHTIPIGNMYLYAKEATTSEDLTANIKLSYGPTVTSSITFTHKAPDITYTLTNIKANYSNSGAQILANGSNYATVTGDGRAGRGATVISSETNVTCTLTFSGTHSGFSISSSTEVHADNRGTVTGNTRTCTVIPTYKGATGSTTAITQQENSRYTKTEEWIPTSLTVSDIEIPSSGIPSGTPYVITGKWSGTHISSGYTYTSGAKSGITTTTYTNANGDRGVFISACTYQNQSRTDGVCYTWEGKEEQIDSDFPKGARYRCINKIYTNDNGESEVLTATTTFFITGNTNGQDLVITASSNIKQYRYYSEQKYVIPKNNFTVNPSTCTYEAGGPKDNYGEISASAITYDTTVNYGYPKTSGQTSSSAYKDNIYATVIYENDGFKLATSDDGGGRWEEEGTQASLTYGSVTSEKGVCRVYPTDFNRESGQRPCSVKLSIDEYTPIYFSGTTTPANVTFTQQSYS